MGLRISCSLYVYHNPSIKLLSLGTYEVCICLLIFIIIYFYFGLINDTSHLMPLGLSCRDSGLDDVVDIPDV